MSIFSKNNFDDCSQAGFAMPLCLIAIALLALSATTLIELVSSGTARAQFAQTHTDKDWAQHSIEQQIIWRALVETSVRQNSNEFRAPSEQLLTTQSTAGAWNTVSDTFGWSGVHGNNELEAYNFNVRIQDARGLLDINYSNPNYLNFLARIVEVPASKRRRAADDLLKRIADFKGVTLIGDESFRTKSITGIDRREELCQLDRWSEIDMCEEGSSLFRFITFGNGVPPNINLTPSYLRDEMGVDDRNATTVSATMNWSRIQQLEGFYDPMLISSSAGFRYHIWIFSEHFDSSRFIVVDMQKDDQGRPFSVRNRIDESASLNQSD